MSEHLDTIDPRRLAARADPRSELVELGQRPVHRLSDGWFVVGRPADVGRLLVHPAATIGLVPVTGDPIAALQARMARFSDGAAHRAQQARTEALLCRLDGGALRREAARTVGPWLRAGTVDLMPLARRVPATILAGALGLPDPDAAVDDVELLSRRLARATASVDRPHACPGADLATAMAAGFVDALAARGAALADHSPQTYEPRPNLRIPVSLVVEFETDPSDDRGTDRNDRTNRR